MSRNAPLSASPQKHLLNHNVSVYFMVLKIIHRIIHWCGGASVCTCVCVYEMHRRCAGRCLRGPLGRRAGPRDPPFSSPLLAMPPFPLGAPRLAQQEQPGGAKATGGQGGPEALGLILGSHFLGPWARSAELTGGRAFQGQGRGRGIVSHHVG